MLRRSIKLICVGWLPPEHSASRACLALGAEVCAFRGSSLTLAESCPDRDRAALPIWWAIQLSC